MGVQATAGFCSECATYVWLREDGSCQHGHPPSAVSGSYEVWQPVAQQTQAPDASRRPKSRRRLVLAIVLGAVVALGLITAGVIVVSPIVGKVIRLSGEWKGRLNTDYPGWKIKRFDVGSSTVEGSKTAWTFTLVPPGRDFTVGVVYLKGDDGIWASQDDILRPGGPYHERAESLLDYLERNYAEQGRHIVSVSSTLDGGALVSWDKSGGVGPVAWNSNGSDELTYDETAGTWSE
jgi:hypothetical protein